MMHNAAGAGTDDGCLHPGFDAVEVDGVAVGDVRTWGDDGVQRNERSGGRAMSRSRSRERWMVCRQYLNKVDRNVIDVWGSGEWASR